MKRNKIESGRSMVEMLGVLAIIGVLSVGGIAGYQAAVTKIRLNKFQNFLNFRSLALQDIYAKGNEVEFIPQSVTVEAYKNNRDVILDTGLIPDDYQQQLDFVTVGYSKMQIYVGDSDESGYSVHPIDFTLKKDYLEGCRNLLSLKYPENVIIWAPGIDKAKVWHADSDSSETETFCQAVTADYKKAPASFYYMWISNLENLPR